MDHEKSFLATLENLQKLNLNVLTRVNIEIMVLTCMQQINLLIIFGIDLTQNVISAPHSSYPFVTRRSKRRLCSGLEVKSISDYDNGCGTMSKGTFNKIVLLVDSNIRTLQT